MIAGTSGTTLVSADSASANGSTSKSASWSACCVPSSTAGSSSTTRTLIEFDLKRLELLESLFYARFLKARAAFGQFLQRDLVGFDDLEQGLIHPRERVREGFFHVDLAAANANVNAFSDLAHHTIDLLQAQFAHLQRLKREVANGGAYLLVLLYRLGSHRLEHLVRIDRWVFHLIPPAYS